MFHAMQVDIFYRSYANDFEWLKNSLKSVEKYCDGFGGVHVAIPATDIGEMPSVGSETVHLVEQKLTGYMDQQVTKIHADEFCRGDYVLHVDSDCIFYKETRPEDFFLDGRPVILREEGVESPWFEISARSLGWRCDGEYMRRLPILYPRWIYKAFRIWMEEKHGCKLWEWLDKQPTHEFSEFNTLGQWAYKFHRKEFAWLHPSDLPVYCKQYWSWGGIGEHRAEIEKMLAK